MAVPALRAVRTSFPNATISVVVDSIGKELLLHCPYVDRLIRYDKRREDRGILGYLRVLHEIRQVKPTHALVLKRFFRNGLLSFLSGARIRVGFETNGKAPFLTHTVKYVDTLHIAKQNLQAVELLGAKPLSDKLEVFIGADDERQAWEWLSYQGIKETGYVCVHYGGTTVDAQFMPLSAFASLVRKYTDRRRVVLLGSGERELTHAAQLSQLIPESSVAVNIPLRTSIAILNHAAAFVGFDSGPMHLAAACELRGIVVADEDSYKKNGERWRPLFDGLRVHPARRGMTDREWEAWTSRVLESH